MRGGGSLVDLLISKSVSGSDVTSNNIEMDFSEIDLTPYKTLKIDIYIDSWEEATSVNMNIPIVKNDDSSKYTSTSYRNIMETSIGNSINSLINEGSVDTIWNGITIPLINHQGVGSMTINIAPVILQCTIPLLPPSFRMDEYVNNPIYSYGIDYVIRTIHELSYVTRGRVTFNHGWDGSNLKVSYNTYNNSTNFIDGYECRVYGLKF